VCFTARTPGLSRDLGGTVGSNGGGGDARVDEVEELLVVSREGGRTGGSSGGDPDALSLRNADKLNS
jgi:hypothetical protein